MESGALTGRLRSILGPIVAIGLGVLAFLACFDPRVLDATELGWVSRGDIATNFLGWHFFRYEAWTWPPGLLVNYAQGLGGSIALTDSIALVAFVLKPIQAFLPVVFNYLGLWIALCFVLQAFFALRVLQCLGLSFPRAATGALLLCLMPFMLARATLHVPLASHWVVLAAIYVYLDAARRPQRFRRWSVLLPVSILVNAYLFTAVAAVFFASALARLWKGDAATRRSTLVHGTVAGVLTIAALYLVGFFSVDVTPTWGAYGQLQMNLLSWFNSQGLGSLLPPIALAEAGETEAYMYLGAGGIVALGVGAWQLAVARPRIDSRYFPLAFAAVALLAIAVSHRVAFGPYFLVQLPMPYGMQQVLNAFRCSGRLAWLPTYLVMAVAIAGCARLEAKAFAALMVAALGLNLVDARPIRAIGKSMVAKAGHRDHPRCDALPASVERVVFVPRVALEDYSLGDAFDVALCAAEQRQAMNVGYLARLNMARADAASREAAAWLDRAPAPNIAYAYRNPAVASALGAEAETPKLGDFRLFVPGQATPRPGPVASIDPSWAWPLDIAMGAEGRGRDVELTGWAAPLGGMVWSYGENVSLLLPVPPAITSDARLQLHASPTPPGSGDLLLGVKANGSPLPPLMLVAARGSSWYSIVVPAPVLTQARGVLRVELLLPKSAPFDPPRGYPDDRLRLLVSDLRISTRRADMETGRVSASSPEVSVLGAGWSSPEGWGTWSVGKTATLRLPMPAQRQNGLRLRLFGHANGPNGKQEVNVAVANRTLAHWSYVSLGADEWREAEIPASVLPASGDELEIELQIDAPARPAIPGSNDVRTLGIAFAEYQLSSR